MLISFLKVGMPGICVSVLTLNPVDRDRKISVSLKIRRRYKSWRISKNLKNLSSSDLECMYKEIPVLISPRFPSPDEDEFLELINHQGERFANFNPNSAFDCLIQLAIDFYLF